MQTRTERFNALCKSMDVTVKNISLSQCDSNPAPASTGEEKAEVRVPKKRLEETEVYYAAMHELGHHATWKDHPLSDEDFMCCHLLDKPDANTLDNEAAATQWALDNAGETVSPDAYWDMHAALCTYLKSTEDEPPPLFRKVFNRTCEGMKGSTLKAKNLAKEYPDIPKEVVKDTFSRADSLATI